MSQELPYCGSAPTPGELLWRFNLDPVLIIGLIALGAAHLLLVRQTKAQRAATLVGWAVAAGALISPLCALSVALFSARVAQHMILVLVAAPLIALGLPQRQSSSGWILWMSSALFFLMLWFWHMPIPYETTFYSTPAYWCMHVTLFASAIWLWRQLLHHPRQRTAEVLIAGAVTSMQMGLLGAVLALAGHAAFRWHFITTWAWGFTPLQDQQLGGTIMWVPGITLFLWTAVRSLSRMWADDSARAL